VVASIGLFFLFALFTPEGTHADVNQPHGLKLEVTDGYPKTKAESVKNYLPDLMLEVNTYPTDS